MKTTITPSDITGKIYPPCSKSYAQRAFATALLTEEESILHNIELCDDAKTALNVIKMLGADVRFADKETIIIRGGMKPVCDVIDVANSGLAVRLFAPIAALGHKEITFSSPQQSKQRNFEMLLWPLRELGAEVAANKGTLPMKLKGPLRGGECTIDWRSSSQFLTGLLIALPLVKEDTVLHVNKLDSTHYIDMAIDTVERFGGRIEHNGFNEYFIQGGQRYHGVEYAIEGDWSCASFWLVAGAVAGEVTVNNMNMLSHQPDTAIIDALQRAGAGIVTSDDSITVTRKPLHGFEFDATDHTDLFPILTILAANCEGRSIIKGADMLSYGELDRGAALMEEFPKLGIELHIENGDKLIVEGGGIEGGHVSSRDDHRIAMAEAIAGLTSRKGVTIEDAEAVTKSYPTFWDDLNELTSGKAAATK